MRLRPEAESGKGEVGVAGWINAGVFPAMHGIARRRELRVGQRMAISVRIGRLVTLPFSQPCHGRC